MSVGCAVTVEPSLTRVGAVLAAIKPLAKHPTSLVLVVHEERVAHALSSMVVFRWVLEECL